MKFPCFISSKALCYRLFTPLLPLFIFATPVFLIGCASKAPPETPSSQAVAPTPPVMGSKPDRIPPQLIRDAAGKIIWDRPGAFGPVPKAFQLAGNKSCSSAGNGLMAIGYHPDAKNLAGMRFEGGGFYCFYAPK